MADVTISTIQDFVAFSNGDYGRGTSSAYLDVVLTADLDFNDLKEYDAPYNWAGCTGTWYINFDGQGHKIDNIYYAGSAGWGFFSTLYGSVKNLKLTNVFVTVTGSSSSAAGCVLYLYGNIDNVHISGQIECFNTNLSYDACGLFSRGYGATVTMSSFAGILKGGVVCGIGRDGVSGSVNNVFNCMINAEVVATVDYAMPLGGSYDVFANCEFKGDVKSNGRIMVGSYDSPLYNCILIFGSGSGTRWESRATYNNVYYDSTLAAEGGFTPPSITGATTAELKSATWLREHDFAI
jgi:hypothetical protein